ncbi:MAG: helical backbone metal receptor [Desulfovibrio sp.]|nr:helical backbone metal receptor [Desulfovibrio sp.]
MRNLFFYGFLCLLLALTVTLHRKLERLSGPAAIPADPQRIVSLAPSVTETFYALGLGARVAGVTQFCAWPPDVAAKPRVAGFSDVNFEAVLRLRPDLVALPDDKFANKTQLERMGLPVLALDTRTLSGLMKSIRVVGAATGRGREADAVLDNFRSSIRAARERAEGKARPRVLFSIMHSYQGTGYITEINAVGRDGFYNELIEIAGGVNVYRGNLPFPRLSRESVIFLNPDVIIDVIFAEENLDAVRRDWESLATVGAIRNGRLHLLTDGADTVSGPRSYQTLSRLSRAFHPPAADARSAR